MKSDRDKLGLRGPVNVVLEQTVQREKREGQVKEILCWSVVRTFENDGDMNESVNTNQEGLTWRTRYERADTGQMLTAQFWNSSGRLYRRIIYLYDSKGRLIGEDSKSEDGTTTSLTKYHYDAHNRITKTQNLSYPQRDTVILPIEDTGVHIDIRDVKHIKTVLDERGYAINMAMTNADEILVSHIDIVRDAVGNPVEVIICSDDNDMSRLYDSGRSSVARDTSIMDGYEDVQKTIEFGPQISKYMHTYDNVGRLVESVLSICGRCVRRKLLIYDDAGYKFEELFYDGQGVLVQRVMFRRELDEYLNWTMEIASIVCGQNVVVDSPSVDTIIRRQITYFKQ